MPKAGPNAAWAYVGLGANLGQPKVQIEQAMALLVQHFKNLKCASLYSSAPVQASGPRFLNTAVGFACQLLPHELLAHLQAIENQLGRERPYPNAPRLIDLDLLVYGAHQVSDEQLTLPHPRLHQRAFVLKPLIELESLTQERLSIGGKTLSQWLALLPDQDCHLV